MEKEETDKNKWRRKKNRLLEQEHLFLLSFPLSVSYWSISAQSFSALGGGDINAEIQRYVEMKRFRDV